MAELEPNLKKQIEDAVSKLTPEQKSALCKQLEAQVYIITTCMWYTQSAASGGALAPTHQYYYSLVKQTNKVKVFLPIEGQPIAEYSIKDLTIRQLLDAVAKQYSSIK